MRPDQNKEQDSCCKQAEPESIRHKKFNECGIEEQVLRLHAVMRGLQQSLRWSYDVQSRLQTKLFALEHHQHSSNGDCMLRIEDVNRGSNQVSSSELGISIDYLD